ncbi:ferlin peroxisome membrane [Diplodia corticola]|uniref:Ferlin peroxisome membrane n=1 Tax=Diplodia corticola TaxID=236234 RepID=A0A1J9QTM6_9PEZI|nr:ferlin peroxisome membrane [Diplodia corticola]OJD31745.1 ferlin peroxisome membrane [Diplodia corticola]
MSLLGLAHSRNDDADIAAKYDHQIELVDHTKPDDGDRTPSEISSGTQTPLSPKPSRRLNRASIREDLAKRGLARQKYARWQQDRFVSVDEVSGSGSGDTSLIQIDTKASGLRSEEGDANSKDSGPISRKKSKLERGKKRVKGLVNSKKIIKQSKEEDAVVDQLYENQRGSFFFGIPLFSSKSLLNFDPSPWVDGRHKPVHVNITNAAVPDPSWEWAWPSWYVDMSQDVDEEGWQYSFSFRHGFAWHGTHPWFHSFVRRRRWLRKRVRKHATLRSQPDPKHISDAHMLNSEYFTIHPPKKTSNHGSESLARANPLTRLDSQDRFDQEDEISDVSRLLRRLKKASVDREKILLVRRFLDEGGEELYYLSEQMPTIMSLLVYQSSRRYLLTVLFRRFEAASAHREAHQERDQRESSPETRKIDNLVRALNAADEECRKLEYWSDIRRIAQRGESLGAVDASQGWGHGWEGLDDTGPAEADESGAEKFKEDGTPSKTDSDDEPEKDQEKAVQSNGRRDSGSDAEQDENGHADGAKDKGKGKAEL